jgi:hypothetical protein
LSTTKQLTPFRQYQGSQQQMNSPAVFAFYTKKEGTQKKYLHGAKFCIHEAKTCISKLAKNYNLEGKQRQSCLIT